jgi:hypothetical protein
MKGQTLETGYFICKSGWNDKQNLLLNLCNLGTMSMKGIVIIFVNYWWRNNHTSMNIVQEYVLVTTHSPHQMRIICGECNIQLKQENKN